ncbi:MAG: deoxyhypusine synthase [Aigarchaeota archaeon]|nr:deoxyhypusine synthase [Aigarchaeota archaeon]MDW8021570.1 deoxyhypusine synthase [Nitrososphaerota archaeon]
MRLVKDIEIRPGMKVSELLDQFEESGGFAAKYLGSALRILEAMVKDRECTRFLSFVGAPISTGLRGALAEAVKLGFFDVIITTCGALDHDIARALGNYYIGDFWMDDERLREQGYHRVGSVVIPLSSYGPAIEKFVQELLEEAYERGLNEFGTFELCKLIGERLKDEHSVLYWAAKREVKVFVPGIMDGAVGTQLWIFQQRRRDFRINPFKDASELADLVFESKKSGALIIGGGISKHHTLWWNQFREGLDYAIYVTTACEYDGSLSGAPVREAISWGKIKPEAMKVTVYGEATIIIPLLFAALLDKIQ